ncbi:hypothetical protein C8J56DRAFT_63088 [Mycena floridula]|nr:hypothetical protein C8J56DRAFT_63088 [Mycena floridula]
MAHQYSSFHHSQLRALFTAAASDPNVPKKQRRKYPSGTTGAALLETINGMMSDPATAARVHDKATSIQRQIARKAVLNSDDRSLSPMSELTHTSKRSSAPPDHRVHLYSGPNVGVDPTKHRIDYVLFSQCIHLVPTARFEGQQPSHSVDNPWAGHEMPGGNSEPWKAHHIASISDEEETEDVMADPTAFMTLILSTGYFADMAKKDPQQAYQFLAWAADGSELLPVALLAPTDAARIASPFVPDVHVDGYGLYWYDGDDVSSGNWEPHLTSIRATSHPSNRHRFMATSSAPRLSFVVFEGPVDSFHLDEDDDEDQPPPPPVTLPGATVTLSSQQRLALRDAAHLAALERIYSINSPKFALLTELRGHPAKPKLSFQKFMERAAFLEELRTLRLDARHNLAKEHYGTPIDKVIHDFTKRGNPWRNTYIKARDKFLNIEKYHPIWYQEVRTSAEQSAPMWPNEWQKKAEDAQTSATQRQLN